MESAQVVRQLWDRIQARDWTAVGDLVAPDAVIEWPVSAERIVGSANYVAVNREYPEGWQIRMLRLVASGDQVVSEVEVPHSDFGVFRVASFWTVRGGQVTCGTEYWTTLAADQSPPWRAAYVERI